MEQEGRVETRRPITETTKYKTTVQGRAITVPGDE